MTKAKTPQEAKTEKDAMASDALLSVLKTLEPLCTADRNRVLSAAKAYYEKVEDY